MCTVITDVTGSGAVKQQIKGHGGYGVDKEPTLDVVECDLPRIRHNLRREKKQFQANFAT